VRNKPHRSDMPLPPNEAIERMRSDLVCAGKLTAFAAANMRDARVPRAWGELHREQEAAVRRALEESARAARKVARDVRCAGIGPFVITFWNPSRLP